LNRFLEALLKGKRRERHWHTNGIKPREVVLIRNSGGEGVG